MNSRVDLNLFKVFNSIYTEGNLTKAAEVLHLTQPAISHSLARLREALDDPLFQRKGTRMVPTPFSQSIINDVRQSLALLEKATQRPDTFNFKEEKRQFVLSLPDILESTCLPPLISYIEHNAPGISIVSQRLPRKDLESMLSSGKIDFAIDVLLPVSENIAHERMSQDQLVVVARKDHPNLHTGLDIYSYLSQKHILVSSRVEGPGIEDFELSRQGLKRNVALRCQHYFAACRVVSGSDYLLTMPAAYARVINSHLDNMIYDLPVELPSLDVHLYWHQQVDNDPANRWMRSQILRLATETLALNR